MKETQKKNAVKKASEVVANCENLQTLKFRPTLPFAFTEQGIGQLSTVVHSKIAIETSFYRNDMLHTGILLTFKR